MDCLRVFACRHSLLVPLSSTRIWILYLRECKSPLVCVCLRVGYGFKKTEHRENAAAMRPSTRNIRNTQKVEGKGKGETVTVEDILWILWHGDATPWSTRYRQSYILWLIARTSLTNVKIFSALRACFQRIVKRATLLEMIISSIFEFCASETLTCFSFCKHVCRICERVNSIYFRWLRKRLTTQ